MTTTYLPSQPNANILWFLPTHGDGRYLGTTDGARAVALGYLRQIAQAADELGYYGVLLPTGRSLRGFLGGRLGAGAATGGCASSSPCGPACRSPRVAARMAATLDRISDGRLLINVVTGGDPVETSGDGVFLAHDERYAVTDEFLHIWRGLMAGETVDVRGQALRDRGRQADLPAGAEALPAAVFRRLVGRRHRRSRPSMSTST